MGNLLNTLNSRNIDDRGCKRKHEDELYDDEHDRIEEELLNTPKR